MNKLYSSPPSLTYPIASFADLQVGRRLIVLVPDSEIDLPSATRRIWELANTFGSHIQLLGLCSDAARESSLRRQLVTMMALLQDGKLSVTTSVEFGGSWIESLRKNSTADDLIVCFREQQTGLTRKPLSQILESNLAATVYVLDGFAAPTQPRPGRVAVFAAWTGSIAIMLGFLGLQVHIDRLASDWIHSALLLLSIPVEVLLIWAWNSFVG